MVVRADHIRPGLRIRQLAHRRTARVKDVHHEHRLLPGRAHIVLARTVATDLINFPKSLTLDPVLAHLDQLLPRMFVHP